MKKVFSLMLAICLSIGSTLCAEQQDITTLISKAQSGNANAQYELANRYINGEGVDKNELEAVIWLQKASKKGLANARTKLKELVGRKNECGETLLFMAIDAENSDACKALIKAGADVNAKNDEGKTPLMRVQSAALCKILIKAGANVNATTTSGMTPLMMAQSAAVCKALIKAGADINAKDADGWTALMYNGYKTAEACQALIDAGADVNAVSTGASKTTPLLNAADCSLYGDEDAKQWTEMCKVLLKAGADVNAIGHGGRTSLMHAACSKRKAEVCLALIAAGADVNAKDVDGWTALLIAADNSSAEVCKALIAAGADVNAKNSYGVTPLMIAAQKSTAEDFDDTEKKLEKVLQTPNEALQICKMLIEAKADVNACNNAGQTALQYAKRKKEIQDFLRAHGAK